MPIAFVLTLFYTEFMETKKIKKLYTYTSIFILFMAVGVTGYFVKIGLEKKNQSPAPALTPPQEEDKKESLGAGNQVASEYQLLIPKISLDAPIIPDVDGKNKANYNKALENGVAQMKGSALPGKNGNSFIFGHSSYYSDEPGAYKEVFAKLNELNPGDVFEVRTKQARYVYSITDKRIVMPNDVEVAAQNTALKQMTLMTCWPLGTTEKRLVVVGELLPS